jgi:hypothetical protein
MESVVSRLSAKRNERGHQGINFGSHSSHSVNIKSNHPRECARGATIIKRSLGVIEELDPTIPIRLRPRIQFRTQGRLIELGGLRVMSVAKEFVKVFILEMANAGNFQFQQRVLTRVHIHCMHMRRSGQRIIERIASRRCDDQNSVVFGQLQRFSV